MQVRVHITADKTIRELKQLRSLMDNWKDELGDVTDYLEKFYREDVFETEGGVYNKRWQRLNPAYEQQKRVKYAGRGILERTGKMRKSWDREVGKTHLKLWNTTKYAIRHQEGIGVPKRAIVDELPARQIRHIENLFKQSIIRKIQQAA